MPSAAPMTIIPRPIAAPNKCRTAAFPAGAASCANTELLASATNSAIAEILPTKRTLFILCPFDLVMHMNGHPDENCRQQREHIGLDHHDDDFQGRDADSERYRHHEADTDTGQRLAELLGEQEHERQYRQDGDMSAGHVGRKSHGQCERPYE